MTSVRLATTTATDSGTDPVADFLEGWSIEVTPRTLAKVPDLANRLPAGTEVYLAHIEGTPFEEMEAAAARLRADDVTVIPHLPARIIPGHQALRRMIEGYAALGIRAALVLGGGARQPAGPFASAMDILESGLLTEHGFRRIDMAGHPEGNRDIDPDGGTKEVDAALLAKEAWAEAHRLESKIITQFVFDANPVIDWAHRIATLGVRSPIRVGLAGPARLQTLIKYAMACGVGPSLKVLQKRAKDLSKLLKPFTPDPIIEDLARHVATHGRLHDATLPPCLIEGVHIFPLGGISTAIDWALERSAPVSG